MQEYIYAEQAESNAKSAPETPEKSSELRPTQSLKSS
jgi:hypothetical protein